MPPLPAIANFVILIALLVFAVRKPLTAALKQRQDQWQKDVSEAEELRIKTEEMLSDAKDKIDRLQQEVSDIFNQARKQAEKDKAEILAQARKQAEKILEDAKRLAEAEKAFAEKAFKKDLLKKALEQAKAELAGKVSQSDHKTFVESLIHGVGEKRA